MSNPPTQTQPGSDPLASLHKMSRTAGLGSTDYVEVNPTAVAALLLGLASAGAVIFTILLVIPIVTLIVAVVAIRQIRRSAGTQTGTAVALIGMILALACVGFIGGREVIKTQRIKAESAQIMALMEALGSDLSKADYESAWGKFGERFQQRVKKEEFISRWQLVQNHPMYGQVKSMKSNGIVDVRLDSETETWYGVGVILIDLANGNNDRRQGTFRKDEQQGWVFEDVEGFFPSAPARTPQRAPQPG
jgi:hypothetical protein